MCVVLHRVSHCSVVVVSPVYITLSDHAGGEKRLGLFEIELRKRDHFIDFTLLGRLLSEAKGRCTALRSIRNLSKPNPGVTRERFPAVKGVPSSELEIRLQ